MYRWFYDLAAFIIKTQLIYEFRNEKKETPQQRTNNSIIVKLENEIDKYSLLPNVMNGLVTSGNMQKITEILFNLCNDKRKVLLETKLTKGYNEELTHR